MVAPAQLPPPGLPGLQEQWSRLVPVTGADGIERAWHLLDSGTASGSAGTLLCVHGNPTWSYLWRGLVAAAPMGWRVIAVDQLGMGYSERLPGPRTLGQRIADLTDLTAVLGLTGPVITVAHDWGGAISLGWALQHRDQLAGIVLTNTAVHQPAGSPAPALIRLARAPGIRQLVCQWTPMFVRGTTALSWPVLPAAVRSAFAAPYATSSRRAAVADFVADIPLDSSHPSSAALAEIVAGLPELAVPALFLWGPRDPVFSDRYLRDLMARFPDAAVHRFEGASHLVTEDRPEFAAVIQDWVGQLPDQVDVPASTDASQLFAMLHARRAETEVAVQDGGGSITFAQLAIDIDVRAAELMQLGVRAGSRVALLVPPGIELTVLIYACWRLGAITVLADAGLGLRGMGRALRGAGPDFVIGAEKGLLAARAMRLSAAMISVASTAAAVVGLTRARLLTQVADSVLPPIPAVDAEAAVLFTSGATGPAKGVVYRHGQLMAQAELLRSTYGITADDRLVAAFAPFALYGPALGIASVVPVMDVTEPATLTAAALADAVTAINASMVFAAPAALRNVVATAANLSPAARQVLRSPRLVLSAGAPVPISLQRQVAALLPNASVHTPYGMTEALPVTDVALTELAGLAGTGVCVGRPVPGVEVRISPLEADGSASGPPVGEQDVTGEICVRASHVKDRYDRLWATEALSSRDQGWHRSGDVGHLDDAGRLWVQGRLRDVITTPDGPLTPVPVEQAIEALGMVAMAAVVGVGPAGVQQPAAVVVLTGPTGRGLRLADADLAAQVRAAARVDLAAVLVTPKLPVDIRHNSKIDRRRVARDASRVLAGKGRLHR